MRAGSSLNAPGLMSGTQAWLEPTYRRSLKAPADSRRTLSDREVELLPLRVGDRARVRVSAQRERHTM